MLRLSDIVSDILAGTGPDLLALEPAAVLSLGLLALGVLSFFLGIAGFITLWRVRPSSFPPAARRSVWRGIASLTSIALLNLVGLPALGYWGYTSTDAMGELWQVGVLSAMLIGLLISNFTAVSIQRRLGQLRLHGETDPAFVRKALRTPTIIRVLRENVIAGTALLAISILIWYLIDKQLSDTFQPDDGVTVEIQLRGGEGLSEAWTIINQDPERVLVRFQGPREQIQSLRRQGTRITGVIEVRPENLQTNGDSTVIRLERRFSDIQFTSSDLPLPRDVSAQPVPGADQPITFQVASNVRHSLPVDRQWLLDALVDKPAEFDLHIRGRDPDTVWLVYPERAQGRIARLEFEEKSLQDLASVSPSPDDTYTKTLRIDTSDTPYLRVFADEAFTRQILEVKVEFNFRSEPELVESRFEDVPVVVSLPNQLMRQGITVDYSDASRPVVLRGPEERFRTLDAGGLALFLVIDASAIRMDELEAQGFQNTPAGRWVLVYSESGQIGSASPTAGDIRLVEPAPDQLVGVVVRKTR